MPLTRYRRKNMNQQDEMKLLQRLVTEGRLSRRKFMTAARCWTGHDRRGRRPWVGVCACGGLSTAMASCACAQL